jgi:hypothetical protein
VVVHRHVRLLKVHGEEGGPVALLHLQPLDDLRGYFFSCKK